MLSTPTTDQVLVAIATELREVIAPNVTDDRATVALQQIDQLLARAARRSGGEIGWMVEEMAAIDAALSSWSDESVTTALAAYRAAAATSWHLADVRSRYHLASVALEAAIDHAFASGDTAAQAAVRELLDQRIANEQTILGTLDLVGRG
jgi:hypothetical protein